MAAKPVGKPGIGVDAAGGGVIDPTKNVEDLVKALQSSLEELRTSDQRYLDAQLAWTEKLTQLERIADTKATAIAAQAESRLRDSLRAADRELAEAETRRIDQLAQTSERFETTIRNMLAESVRTTSDLVSNQLVQIQATFNERVSKLEAGAFTQAGKSSVQDPATADAISRMASGIAALTQTTTEAMNKSAMATAEAIAKLTTAMASAGGHESGKIDTNAKLYSIIALVASVASPVLAYLALRGGH